MRYPVVLLDVGGTLIGPSVSFGAVYAQVVGSLGLAVEADEVETKIWQVWEEMARAIPAGIDRYAHFPGGENEFWLRFARRTLERATGQPLQDGFAMRAAGRIREAFMDPAAWKVFPDVRPALERLKADGARFGVVSNWDSRLPRVLEMLDLASYFEQVAVSHCEGVEKPDPEIFRRVLERMGARPETVVHVGDRPEIDLAGANAAGIDAVLVDRRGRIEASPRPLADLCELPRIARGEPPPGF